MPAARTPDGGGRLRRLVERATRSSCSRGRLGDGRRRPVCGAHQALVMLAEASIQPGENGSAQLGLGSGDAVLSKLWYNPGGW